MKNRIVLFIIHAVFSLSLASAQTLVSRVLKFSGVPSKIALQIKKHFPFVFEREVSLAEIDEIVRFLMQTGQFSSVEAVEQDRENGSGREIAVVTSLLRHIQDVKVHGNLAISSSDVLRALGVAKNQVFERKNLVNSAEELRKAYENLGYHNAKVEIDFSLPNESEVVVDVTIVEAEPIRISEVIVDSADAELGTKLTRMAGRLKNRVLTEDELLDYQKEVSEYFLENRYLTAKMGAAQVSLDPGMNRAKVTYAVDNPWKFDFQFSGNLFFTDGTLIHQIEDEKFTGSQNPTPDMAEKIRRYYQSFGYANVEVAYSEKLNEQTGRMEVKLGVSENPRVRIKKISVVGNISRPEQYYAQFIKGSSSKLGGLGYYNRQEIEDGTKKLVLELQNQGFLRAKVQSQRAEYSTDRSKVTIVLAIDEGPLTQIRQIRIEGNESFPKARLLDVIKIKPGAALGLKELDDSITALKNFYHSQGLLEMRILNDSEQSRIVTYNEGNTQATVEFQIFEGPVVRVGSIALQGNSFTKDNVILRELPFLVGDILTPEKLDETTFRLQKLNLFSRVNIRTLEEGTNISERTVVIEIAEKDPGTFILRFGGTNENNFLTFRGIAGISYDNLWGTGRGTALRLEPKYSLDPRVSYIEHTITASYTEPYIFGDRNRGRINLIRDLEVFQILPDPVSGDHTTIQEANTIGFLFDRELTRKIRLTLDVYSFSNLRQFDRYTNQTTKTVNIAKFGPLIEFDFRDDVFNPTTGTYSYVNLEYSDPILGSSKDSVQTVNFFKSTAATTVYQRLFPARKEWVWVNQIRGGYLANLSSDLHAGVPYQETFSLGGRSTIRGFNENSNDEKIPNLHEVGLDDPVLDPNGFANFVVRADSYFGLFKTELWFPIYGALGGTVFYDGGAVFINQPDVSIPVPYRDSIGTGIRVTTPVGPLNLQVGWKLRRLVVRHNLDGTDSIESPFQVHLSFGVF